MKLHLLLIACVLLAPAGARAYKRNGFTWPKDRIPVKYYINEKGSKDLGAETFTIVQQAMAVWEKVGCSDFRWKYMGKTKDGVGLDFKTVIAWEEKNWVYGQYAAAATSFIGEGKNAQGDIAFNGVDFKWKKGGADVFYPFIVDPAAVTTHEAGHLLGLSHTTDDYVATMGHAYVSGAGQRTLALDDKLGICSIYPADKPKDECQTDCDCPTNAVCKYVSTVKINLCVEFRDPINAPCTGKSINCPGQCVFTLLDAIKKKAEGLCTVGCSKEGETCKNGWKCKKATTNLGQGQLVCVADKPKADPPPKSPRKCTPDAGVPDAGKKDGSVDAGGGEEDDEGCSCGVGGTGGAWTFVGLLLLGLAARRRRLS